VSKRHSYLADDSKYSVLDFLQVAVRQYFPMGFGFDHGVILLWAGSPERLSNRRYRWANTEVQQGSQFMWKAYPAMGAFSDFPRSGLNLRCTRAFADLGDGLPSPLVPVQTIESEPVTIYCEKWASHCMIK
jgi:hypothetical protein